MSELILFNDAALRKDTALEKDAFDLLRKLKPIYSAVLSPATETPFSVMVSGGWGTGKTSSMRWLDEHLRATGDGKDGRLKVDTCWFYPWKYQDREDVWKGLIAEVILASIDFENVDTSKIVMAARQFGKFLGGSFVRVLSGVKVKLEGGGEGAKAGAEFDVKEALTGIIEEYGKHVTPQDAYYNVFEKTLEEWIKRCYKGNNRLVIFIDDLDRCLPTIALQVLESIKLYLNIPNLVVVVGVDRQVIDAVVMKHYEQNLGGMAIGEIKPKARQYLDKMFQVEVPIAPRDEQVADYIETQLERTSLWNRIGEEHQPIFQGIIREIADINPRSVVRALNTAIVGAEDEKDELRVAQSMQRALITTVLQKLPENEFGPVHDLCLREEGRRFFHRWSHEVVANPKQPNYLDERELEVLDNTHNFGFEPSTDDPSLLLELAKEYTKYNIDSKAPTGPNFRKLLTQRTLGLLMRIPFADEESAESETAATTRSKQLDWTPLIELVAKKHRVGMDQVTPEALNNTTELDLSYTAIPDAAWPLIGTMTKLRTLDLHAASVTYSGLAHVSVLKSLQSLHLGGTYVTNAGIAQLEKLAALQTLDLNDTLVSDTGLVHLANLPSLQSLSLRNTKVTDEGLAHLTNLADLRSLDLVGAQVTDPGLAHLKGLTRLSELHLSGTLITDDGISYIKGLTNLQMLSLRKTLITDDGLADISTFRGLRKLYINDTKATKIGLAKLEKELPNCEIIL